MVVSVTELLAVLVLTVATVTELASAGATRAVLITVADVVNAEDNVTVACCNRPITATVVNAELIAAANSRFSSRVRSPVNLNAPPLSSKKSCTR